MPPEEVEIRLAEEGDIAGILAISNRAAEVGVANFSVTPEPPELWNQAFRETHRMFPWLVATPAPGNRGKEDTGSSENQIRGFAKASPHNGRCAYDWTAEVTVYIHHEHLGKGIGSRLYEVLFDLLERQGYRSVTAGVSLPNPASIALHEKFGMKKIGAHQRVGWKFGEWHDVGYWQGFLGEDTGEPGIIRTVEEVWGEAGNRWQKILMG